MLKKLQLFCATIKKMMTLNFLIELIACTSLVAATLSKPPQQLQQQQQQQQQQHQLKQQQAQHSHHQHHHHQAQQQHQNDYPSLSNDYELQKQIDSNFKFRPYRSYRVASSTRSSSISSPSSSSSLPDDESSNQAYRIGATNADDINPDNRQPYQPKESPMMTLNPYSLLSYINENHKKLTNSLNNNSTSSYNSKNNTNSGGGNKCHNPDQEYLEDLLAKYQIFFRKYEELMLTNIAMSPTSRPNIGKRSTSSMSSMGMSSKSAELTGSGSGSSISRGSTESSAARKNTVSPVPPLTPVHMRGGNGNHVKSELFNHHVDQTQCLVQKRNLTTLNQQSLCPWKYMVAMRVNKYPPFRPEVKCTCDKCTTLSSELVSETGCMPVLKAMPVLVRGKCDDDGFYMWMPTVEHVNVACVCAYRNQLIPIL